MSPSTPFPVGGAQLLVQNVTFTPARAGDVSRGLLGYLEFQIGDHIALSGVALRRTMHGAITLSFPVRKDRTGRRHRVARLLSEHAKVAVQAQVVAVLRARGVIR